MPKESPLLRSILLPSKTAFGNISYHLLGMPMVGSINIKKKVFYNKGSESLEEDTQRGGGCRISLAIQGWSEWSSFDCFYPCHVKWDKKVSWKKICVYTDCGLAVGTQWKRLLRAKHFQCDIRRIIQEVFLLNICKIFRYLLVIIVGKQSFVFRLAEIKCFEETVT